MVHGYHVIWGAYGFWLPNDPRGSWSEFVYSWELARFGRATRSSERDKSRLQDYAVWRDAARKALRYPAVTFTAEQILAVADGFQRFVKKSGLTVWACSILDEHVHMVLARHRYAVEQAVNLLKGEATRTVAEQNLHPMERVRQPQGKLPSMWADKCWKVFLDSEQAIEQAIRYVERNPDREGRPAQHWPFVTPFTGIPLGGWITYH